MLASVSMGSQVSTVKAMLMIVVITNVRMVVFVWIWLMIMNANVRMDGKESFVKKRSCQRMVQNQFFVCFNEI